MGPVRDGLQAGGTARHVILTLLCTGSSQPLYPGQTLQCRISTAIQPYVKVMAPCYMHGMHGVSFLTSLSRSECRVGQPG